MQPYYTASHVTCCGAWPHLLLHNSNVLLRFGFVQLPLWFNPIQALTVCNRALGTSTEMGNCLLVLLGNEVDGQLLHSDKSATMLDATLTLYVHHDDPTATLATRFGFEDLRQGSFARVELEHLPCLLFLRDKEAYEDDKVLDVLNRLISMLQCVEQDYGNGERCVESCDLE